MPIVVEVKSKEDYAQWVAAQKAKAAAAGDDPAKVWAQPELVARGEKVYAANCAACHQATGKGVPPAFPALDGSKVVTGPKDAQIATLLNGVERDGKPTAMVVVEAAVRHRPRRGGHLHAQQLGQQDRRDGAAVRDQGRPPVRRNRIVLETSR